MKYQNSNWKPLSLAFNSNLSEGQILQHHAAQFIALAGNYLIPKQPDDSNTNMEYIPAKKMLVGNILPNGLRLTLHLTDLKIGILDKDANTKKVIVLEGKNKQEVFDELKQSLSDLGVEVHDFVNELHYETPVHELDRSAVFSVKNEFALIENEIYRHNADIAIKEITARFEQASSVRIWPHHFDTGSYIPLYFKKNGDVSKSISIGWTMPDSMVNETYYYLSFWSEKPTDHPEDLKPLDFGKWMLPDWNGAILKHAEIIQQKTAMKQYEMVKSFFIQGIEILFTHLQNN